MILVVGCGPERYDNAINLDLGVDFGPDMVGDARALPFRDRVFDTVVAHDLIEHFPKTDTLPLLREWHRVLKPGGGLEVRCPDMLALATHIQYWHDKPGLETVLDNVFGGGKFGPGGMWDRHFWGFTPASLRSVLDQANFETISMTDAVNFTTKAVKR